MDSVDKDKTYQLNWLSFWIGIVIALPGVYMLRNAILYSATLQGSLSAAYAWGIMHCVLGFGVAFLHGFPVFRRKAIERRRQLEQQLRERNYFSDLISVKIGKYYHKRLALIGELPHAIALFLKLETSRCNSDGYVQFTHKMLNAFDLKLGDEAFDSHFVVTSNEMKDLQRYLSPSVRKLLLALPNVPMQISFVSLNSSDVKFDEPDREKRLARKYWQVLILPENGDVADEIAAVMNDVGREIAAVLGQPTSGMSKELEAVNFESGLGRWWDSILGRIVMLAIAVVVLVLVGSLVTFMIDTVSI